VKVLANIIAVPLAPFIILMSCAYHLLTKGKLP